MPEASEQSNPLDLVTKALEGPEKMATPDLTKAQLIAVVQAIVAALVLLGSPPSDDVVTAAVAAISALVLIMLPTSDALIRRERARHSIEIAEAKRMLRPAPGGMLRESLEEELMRIKDASADVPAVPAPAARPPAPAPAASSQTGATSASSSQQGQTPDKK